MKILKVYKANDEFVIERVNEFNHGTKRFFLTEDGLKEGLDAYKTVMDQYELEVSPELWDMVVNQVQEEVKLKTKKEGK